MLAETRSNNQTRRDVVNERDYCQARLVDHGGARRKVTMEWDLNEQARADKVFKLSIDGKTAYINLEELLRFTRWV